MKSKFGNQVADDVKDQQRRGSTYGHLRLPKGVTLFKEAEIKKILLDFIPYKVKDERHPDRKEETERAIPGALWYKRPYRIHRNIGGDNQTVLCLQSIAKKCPICEYRKKLVMKNADKEDIRALNSSLRNLYLVIPKNHKDFEEKIHIWDISQANFQDILNDEISEEPDTRGCFADLEEGKTLQIRFGEEQLGRNKFKRANRIDFEDREEAYSEKILRKAPCLDDLLEFPSYDSLLEKLMDEEGEDEGKEIDDDEEEEERSPKKRKKKPIEEEEEEEEEEDDDDEEEERPKRRLDKKQRKAREEEEEEEEDEDEEDEEEKEPEPPKKKKKKSKCPHGYTFGKDCEKYDECDDCDMWDACYKAKRG